MKIIVEKSDSEEFEVILRSNNIDSEDIIKIRNYLEAIDKKMLVSKEGVQTLLNKKDIIYCEYVERKVFIYSMTEMFETSFSLSEIEAQFKTLFRCSKNTIINIMHLMDLKSEFNGSISATLSTGEKVMISRHYASKLRKILKGK